VAHHKNLAKPARKSSGRMASQGLPNPVDVYVGQRIRLRRTLLGMSQESLGEGIGLTFQQVQKYERGMNRVSASRIIDLASQLQVAPAYFFDEMPAAIAANSPAHLLGKAPDLSPIERDPATTRRCLELVRYFNAISDPTVRKALYAAVKAAGAANVVREGAL